MLKNAAIGNHLWIVRPDQGIELVDADQGMFVGRVTMKKLVLHQTGQLPEFRNVAAKKIHAVHHSKHTSHFAFTRQDRLENIPWFLRILVGAGDLPEAPA